VHAAQQQQQRQAPPAPQQQQHAAPAGGPRGGSPGHGASPAMSRNPSAAPPTLQQQLPMHLQVLPQVQHALQVQATRAGSGGLPPNMQVVSPGAGAPPAAAGERAPPPAAAAVGQPGPRSITTQQHPAGTTTVAPATAGVPVGAQQPAAAGAAGSVDVQGVPRRSPSAQQLQQMARPPAQTVALMPAGVMTPYGFVPAAAMQHGRPGVYIQLQGMQQQPQVVVQQGPGMAPAPQQQQQPPPAAAGAAPAAMPPAAVAPAAAPKAMVIDG
jgi:hypothetical protein